MKATLLALVLVLTGAAHAQTPDTAWLRTYGGQNADAGQTGQPTFDGGYIFVGTTMSFGAGRGDVWLLKLDEYGDTVWTRTYGGTAGDRGYGVLQTRDSGYIVSGWTTSFGCTDTDAYLVKTDADGDTVWTRTLGGDNTEIVWTVAELYDGGYAICGWSHSYGGRPYGHVFVARTDAGGDSVWARTYGGPYSDFGISIQATPDSGLIVAGHYGTGPGLGVDGYMLKLDMNGDTVWTRRFGGSSNDGLSWVDCTPDRGYIVCGATYSFGAGMADVWMIKLDSLGNQEWRKLYGWRRDDGSRGITRTSDGYIIVGQCDATGWETSDIWVLKTDLNGDTTWAWIYGDDTEWDKAFLAWETHDGGYIVFGETESYGAQDRDFVAVKFEPLVATCEEKPRFTTESGTPTLTHGSLVLRVGPDALLVDVAGRPVMRIKPGDNDIRHLAPGVYFVRREGGCRTTKVVVQR